MSERTVFSVILAMSITVAFFVGYIDGQHSPDAAYCIGQHK